MHMHAHDDDELTELMQRATFAKHQSMSSATFINVCINFQILCHAELMGPATLMKERNNKL